MKAKTIKSVLRKKINDWLDSIDDDKVHQLAAQNTIVTGGCIASMLLGEEINDFDLYFTNKETVLAIANYYVDKFKQNNSVKVNIEEVDDRVKIIVKSTGITEEEPEEKDKSKYRPVFLSSNAITLSNSIQLVIRFYGNPDEIHESYDFTHVTNYWTSSNGELALRPKALETLLTRELIYQGSKYPLASIIRTRKFIKRGWSINAGQYLKMAIQLNELDLTDIEILKDQLIGVDVTYFQEVIDYLLEKEMTKVDAAYLMTVIDRIF